MVTVVDVSGLGVPSNGGVSVLSEERSASSSLLGFGFVRTLFVGIVAGRDGSGVHSPVSSAQSDSRSPATLLSSDGSVCESDVGVLLTGASLLIGPSPAVGMDVVEGFAEEDLLLSQAVEALDSPEETALGELGADGIAAGALGEPTCASGMDGEGLGGGPGAAGMDKLGSIVPSDVGPGAGGEDGSADPEIGLGV